LRGRELWFSAAAAARIINVAAALEQHYQLLRQTILDSLDMLGSESLPSEYQEHYPPVFSALAGDRRPAITNGDTAGVAATRAVLALQARLGFLMCLKQ